jgi:hypothetical protein
MQLKRLDSIVEAAEAEARTVPNPPPVADPKARTAVILVNGFNGLGLHTILNVPRMFGNTFRNFVFVQVGSVDAGNFKGAAEIDALRTHTEQRPSATCTSPRPAATDQSPSPRLATT